MKNAQTTRPGHPPSRNTPVPVSKPKAKAIIARSKKLHPAEAAGMAVHQAVETSVVTAKNTLVAAGGYVAGFVKGLVRGH